MEQNYEIRMERSRLALATRLLIWIFIGLSVAEGVGKYTTFYIILSGCCCIATELIIEKILGSYKVVRISFYEEYVIFRFKHRETKIFYKDIKEVGKTMLLTQYQPEKGNYQMKIKTKNRSYRFITPFIDYQKHLDFEETEFAVLYKAFQDHGVKCC